MNDNPQGDLFTSRKLRDEGVASITATNEAFVDDVLAVIKSFDHGRRFTCNDVRRLVTRSPRHWNAWGAAMNAARRAKLMVKTGVYVQSDRPEAHAHALPEYMRTWDERDEV